MAITRKDALKRLNGLSPRIEEHLTKIAADPNHPSVAHWTHETVNWIKQVEEAASHVGGRTGADWRSRIEGWKETLGG